MSGRKGFFKELKELEGVIASLRFAKELEDKCFAFRSLPYVKGAYKTLE